MGIFESMPKGTMTWRKLGVATGLIALLVISFAIIIDQFVLAMIIGSSDTISVPNVVGMDFEKAQELLQQKELAVMDPMDQYSATVAKGKVLSQLPYANATVKEGRRIYLTISRGIETIKMPTLTGRTLRDARLTLMRIGLQLGDISYENNDSIPDNYIVVQGVPSGADIPAGGSTSVVVSRGPSGSHMPDLLGMTLSEAQVILSDRGLVVGNVKHIPSGTFESNTIVAQDPSPDTKILPTTMVTLTVVK